ncbi:MAG: reverse transcriptase family protein, partial [Nitrososphaeraceae archaeon]|nr:reverse transcriptase family protein [Nitrososphaeraceae archaeon]
LRLKNSLMHSGKLEKANAIDMKVGKIARHNSTRLSHLDIHSGTKELWEEVRRLTSPANPYQLPKAIDSQILNDHYDSISNDPGYSSPMLKVFVQPPADLVTEQQVFHLLDKLKHTASGPDNIPAWFLRLAAPVFAAPLSHLINISFSSAVVPMQWKSAVVHPVPKVPNPTLPNDFRPISVVPILSRLAERLLVRDYLTPSLTNLPQQINLMNQFAYRPTTSTTAALISILSHVSQLLCSNTHVFLIAFDYSKAFDTLSHSSLASKLSNLSIPDCIFNWILDYLTDRSHTTYIKGSSSSLAKINASIVQGSVLGPTRFNINSSELKPLSSDNAYFKYADDSYLIVPSSNAHTILPEIQHHASWAAGCNLKFNIAKMFKLCFCNKKIPPPRQILGS